MENTPKSFMKNLWNANGWLGEPEALWKLGFGAGEFLRGEKKLEVSKEKSPSSQGLNSKGGGRNRIEVIV